MKVPVCCPHVFLIQLGTTRVEFQGSAEKERNPTSPAPPSPLLPCSPSFEIRPSLHTAPSHALTPASEWRTRGRSRRQAMLDRASHARKGTFGRVWQMYCEGLLHRGCGVSRSIIAVRKFGCAKPSLVSREAPDSASRFVRNPSQLVASLPGLRTSSNCLDPGESRVDDSSLRWSPLGRVYGS